MAIDFGGFAWTVHEHKKAMKAVFCWAWNRSKQVPFLRDCQE